MCIRGAGISSAAGHLEVGEAYEDSARRELGEELGQDGEELALVGKLPASEKTGMEFVGAVPRLGRRADCGIRAVRWRRACGWIRRRSTGGSPVGLRNLPMDLWSVGGCGGMFRSCKVGGVGRD